MKSIEEKAHKHAVDAFRGFLKAGHSTAGLLRDAIKDAYIAGATEALAGQWRKPEDELPEMRQRVLLCVKEHDSKRPMIGIFKRIPYASDNTNWEWNLGVKNEDVIGWMPLPEPPKDESL